MTARLIVAITGGVVAVIAACGGLAGMMVSGALGGGCATGTNPSVAAPATPPSAPAGGIAPVGAWNPEQLGNAAAIIAVGARMGVPARGWVIAVATPQIFRHEAEDRRQDSHQWAEDCLQ
jgi:hypothetical protein